MTEIIVREISDIQQDIEYAINQEIDSQAVTERLNLFNALKI